MHVSHRNAVSRRTTYARALPLPHVFKTFNRRFRIRVEVEERATFRRVLSSSVDSYFILSSREYDGNVAGNPDRVRR